MTCKYCGAKVPENASTCTLCGATTEKTSPQKTLPIGITLFSLALVLIAVFILINTYFNSSVEINSLQKDTTTITSQENAQISMPNVERIGDAIPVWEIESIRTYRVSSEQTIEEADITDLVYKLQTRAGYYSEKAKILAENDCGTWYVKISIPGTEDEEIFDFICSNASLEFIAGYGTESVEIIVDSSHILSASAAVYNDGLGISSYVVDIYFNEEGTRLFADGTTKYIGDIISIVYDGQVISAPTITTPITEGLAVINGLDSFEEAQKIATFLNAGKLNVNLEKTD